MDTYEKKYKEAFERAKEKYTTCYSPALLEYIFPELKESEGERIRKELLEHCKNQAKPYIQTGNKCPQIQSWIDWLEKQGSEPNWYHHKVDLSDCSEEYRKAYYDGWNNCNMQHSQYKSESNDVVKCLINGMKFYYEDNEEATWGTEKFSMKVKDILSWLKKQGELKETLCEKCKKAQPSQFCQDITALGRCAVEHEQKTDNSYCQENCKGFQETGKCFADGDCKAKRELKSTNKVKQRSINEIPFGAKDSELQEATYFIPKGFHAEIDDDNVVIKKGEKLTAWSKKDEKMFEYALNMIEWYSGKNEDKSRFVSDWLKSIKQRIGG